MTRPKFERVSDHYRPRFPAELTPEEYAELIAPESGTRMLAAAAAASLALGVTLPAQEGPERERQFLALLESLEPDRSLAWYAATTFVRTENAFESPIVLPRIPISFGNSHNGVFDAERARKLAREVFEIYGLHPAPDYKIREDGVRAHP